MASSASAVVCAMSLMPVPTTTSEPRLADRRGSLVIANGLLFLAGLPAALFLAALFLAALPLRLRHLDWGAVVVGAHQPAHLGRIARHHHAAFLVAEPGARELAPRILLEPRLSIRIRREVDQEIPNVVTHRSSWKKGWAMLLCQ